MEEKNIKERKPPIGFSDIWGFNSHPEEKKMERGDLSSKEPSFDEVPAGYGPGRDWER